jgi:hypothetical protein
LTRWVTTNKQLQLVFSEDILTTGGSGADLPLETLHNKVIILTAFRSMAAKLINKKSAASRLELCWTTGHNRNPTFK